MVPTSLDALKLLARALEETELSKGNLTRGVEMLQPVMRRDPAQASEVHPGGCRCSVFSFIPGMFLVGSPEGSGREGGGGESGRGE